LLLVHHPPHRDEGEGNDTAFEWDVGFAIKRTRWDHCHVIVTMILLSDLHTIIFELNYSLLVVEDSGTAAAFIDLVAYCKNNYVSFCLLYWSHQQDFFFFFLSILLLLAALISFIMNLLHAILANVHIGQPRAP